MKLLPFLVLAAPAVAQMVPESPVPALIKMLGSDEPELRLLAAEQLATVLHYGAPPVAAAAPLLARFAADCDESVSQAAAVALCELGPQPEAALVQLASWLPAWREAGAAGEAAAAIGRILAQPGAASATLVPHLVRLLQCRTGVRAVTGVLALLGPDAAAAAPALCELVNGQDESCRWRAAFALAATGGKVDRGALGAVRDGSEAERLWSVRARMRTAPGHVPVEAVKGWLQDGRAPVCRWACASLIDMGSRAEPFLPDVVRALDLVPHARCELLDRLAECGPRAEVAVPALLEFALAPRDCHTWLRTGQALARIAPGPALAVLLSDLEREPEHHHSCTWASVWTLRGMGAAAAPGLPRLVSMLQRDCPLARERALMVLQAMGPRAAPALPWVKQLLGPGPSQVRDLANEFVKIHESR